MKHLIDKDALVAEIQKRRNKHFNSGGSPSSEYCHEDDEILGIINTLEVKEVDLEKEIQDIFQKYKNGYNGLLICKKEDFSVIAKHFFKFGLKAQKGEEV